MNEELLNAFGNWTYAVHDALRQLGVNRFDYPEICKELDKTRELLLTAINDARKDIE